MNYLIDESVSCGKGANAVISMLHHFLENFGFGEQNLERTAVLTTVLARIKTLT